MKCNKVRKKIGKNRPNHFKKREIRRKKIINKRLTPITSNLCIKRRN